MSNQTELLREAVRLLGSSIDDYDNITEGEFSGTSYYEPRMRFSQEARAFLAKIDAAEVDESEFQVISGNEEDACIEAATSGPRDVALREAMRYAHQYAEDGPVKVVELVTVAMLAASQQAAKGEGT